MIILILPLMLLRLYCMYVLVDMAGPVWDSSANKPTGYGVKLLVDYLLNAKKAAAVAVPAATESSKN